MYLWWQLQLCDVFIKVIKLYIFLVMIQTLCRQGNFAQDILWVCLDTGLWFSSIHATEKLWQHLLARSDCARKESIMICDYPSTVKVWNNGTVESEMDMVESVVKFLRTMRSLLPANERHERF